MYMSSPHLQEFEYWVRRNPKILDTLLSFQPSESQGTLGPLLLSHEDGSTSESTVSIPLHPSPLPFLAPQRPTHTGSQGSLEVTHSPLRPIRSEPVLATMETNTTMSQSISTDVVSRETSDAVTVVSKVATSTKSVAVEMGASSPTLVSELDTPLPSGTGPLFTMPTTTELEVKFTTGSDEEREGEGGGGGGRGLDEGGRGGGSEERGGHSGGAEEGATEVPEDGHREQGLQDEVAAVQGEACGGMERVGQAGSIMQSQEVLPLDVNLDLPAAPLQPQPYTPSSPLLPTTMETVALEIQEVVEEVEARQGELKQPLPLPEISELGDSPISKSPHTTSEEGILMNVGSSAALSFPAGHTLEEGEHQLEVMEHHPQDSGAHKLDVQVAGITSPSSFDQLSAPSDPFSAGVVMTHLSDPLSAGHWHPPQLVPLLPPQLHSTGGQEDVAEELRTMGTREDVGPDPVVLPPRRPSPFPEVVAGVKEALYTAWIPNPWTQGVLSWSASVTQQHLTCPGLVADIKAVRTVRLVLAHLKPPVVVSVLLPVEIGTPLIWTPLG